MNNKDTPIRKVSLEGVSFRTALKLGFGVGFGGALLNAVLFFFLFALLGSMSPL
jgi:hypothetical protein